MANVHDALFDMGIKAEDVRKRIDELRGEITASEALWGFVAWLSSRSEPLVLSSKHHATPAADVVKTFCQANNLAEPQDGWEKRLVFPVSDELISIDDVDALLVSKEDVDES